MAVNNIDHKEETKGSFLKMGKEDACRKRQRDCLAKTVLNGSVVKHMHSLSALSRIFHPLVPYRGLCSSTYDSSRFYLPCHGPSFHLSCHDPSFHLSCFSQSFLELDESKACHLVHQREMMIPTAMV